MATANETSAAVLSEADLDLGKLSRSATAPVREAKPRQGACERDVDRGPSRGRLVARPTTNASTSRWRHWRPAGLKDAPSTAGAGTLPDAKAWAVAPASARGARWAAWMSRSRTGCPLWMSGTAPVIYGAMRLRESFETAGPSPRRVSRSSVGSAAARRRTQAGRYYLERAPVMREVHGLPRRVPRVGQGRRSAHDQPGSRCRTTAGGAGEATPPRTCRGCRASEPDVVRVESVFARNRLDPCAGSRFWPTIEFAAIAAAKVHRPLERPDEHYPFDRDAVVRIVLDNERTRRRSPEIDRSGPCARRALRGNHGCTETPEKRRRSRSLDRRPVVAL